MWCPKCRAEYREGVTACAECGVPLVKTLPAQVDASGAEDKVRILKRLDGRENLHALSDGNRAYVEMGTKYEDMKSTAFSFLLVGAGGLLFLALAFAGVIPVQFAAYMKGIMGIVMGGMFFIFLFIGIRSFLQLPDLKSRMEKEKTQSDAARSWFFEQYSAKAVDVSAETDGEDEIQQKYFKRSRFIGQKLREQFPGYEEAFTDYLTEQFYEELFPQD